MSKKSTFIIALLLVNAAIYASTVDLQKATQTGIAFFQAQSQGLKSARPTVSLTLVDLPTKLTSNVPASKAPANMRQVASNAADNAMPEFYVFNNTGGGFVVVSGDDRFTPILGYSFKENIKTDSIPDNIIEWFDGYRKSIRYALDSMNIIATDEVKESWNRLLNQPQKSPAVVVEPLIKTKWNQNKYYNTLCPADSAAGEYNGYRCPTGCTATAIAQIMKYYEYPKNGRDSVNIDFSQTFNYPFPNWDYRIEPSSWSHPEYGGVSANFENTQYDWDNMQLEYNEASTQEQINAVSELMYHIGVSVAMNYGPNESGYSSYTSYSNIFYTSSIHEFALNYFFRYKKPYSLKDEILSSGSWINENFTGKALNTKMYNEAILNLVRADIIHSHPTLINAMGESGGHAFLCDGIDENNFLHVNFGWGGSADGYFNILAEDFSFPWLMAAITGIVPDTAPVNDEKYTIIATSSNGGHISNMGFNSVANTDSMTVYFIADSAYTLVDVLVNGWSDSIAKKNGYITIDKHYQEATAVGGQPGRVGYGGNQAIVAMFKQVDSVYWVKYVSLINDSTVLNSGVLYGPCGTDIKVPQINNDILGIKKLFTTRVDSLVELDGNGNCTYYGNHAETFFGSPTAYRNYAETGIIFKNIYDNYVVNIVYDTIRENKFFIKVNEGKGTIAYNGVNGYELDTINSAHNGSKNPPTCGFDYGWTSVTVKKITFDFVTSLGFDVRCTPLPGYKFKNYTRADTVIWTYPFYWMGEYGGGIFYLNDTVLVNFEKDSLFLPVLCDTTLGSVIGGGYCFVGDTVILSAIPKSNYMFSHWSDGNTDNPRKFVVTEDRICTESTSRPNGWSLNFKNYIRDGELPTVVFVKQNYTVTLDAQGGTGTISIYPNPFSDILNVKSTHAKKIEVTDLYGKIVRIEMQNLQSIDLSSLKPGLYFVSIYTDNNKWTGKIIKQ